MASNAPRAPQPEVDTTNASREREVHSPSKARLPVPMSNEHFPYLAKPFDEHQTTPYCDSPPSRNATSWPLGPPGSPSIPKTLPAAESNDRRPSPSPPFTTIRPLPQHEAPLLPATTAFSNTASAHPLARWYRQPREIESFQLAATGWCSTREEMIPRNVPGVERERDKEKGKEEEREREPADVDADEKGGAGGGGGGD